MSTDLLTQLRAYGEQLDEAVAPIGSSEIAGLELAAADDGTDADVIDLRDFGSSMHRTPRLLVAVAAGLAFIVMTLIALQAGDQNSQDLITDEPDAVTTTTTTTSTTSTTTTTVPTSGTVLTEIPGLPSGEATGLVEAVIGAFAPAGPSGARDFSAAVEALGDDAVWVEPDGVEYGGDEIQELFERFANVATIERAGPIRRIGDGYLLPIVDTFTDGSQLFFWVVVDADADGRRRIHVLTTEPDDWTSQ